MVAATGRAGSYKRNLAAEALVLDYANAIMRNRDVSLLLLHEHVIEFSRIHVATLRAVGAFLDTSHDELMGPFVLIFYNLYLRHTLAGFHNAISRQGFLAWYTLRPGLEGLLFLGKIAEDPANAAIWREPDSPEYQRTFRGAALVSEALPGSAMIRQVVATLNTSYMHPSQRFVARSFQAEELRAVQATPQGVSITFSYFDSDPVYEATVISYTSLAAAVSDSICGMLARLTDQAAEPPAAASEYRGKHSALAQRIAVRHPEAAAVLRAFGGWDLAQQSSG